MEYLVDFTIDIPDGTSSTDVDSRSRAEAERVDALGREGRALRVWRPLPDNGRWRAIGLYRADDEAELSAILESLPLYSWMTISVQALAPHPNDPARPLQGRAGKQ
jgi:muconolactone D-isomerase